MRLFLPLLLLIAAFVLPHCSGFSQEPLGDTNNGVNLNDAEQGQSQIDTLLSEQEVGAGTKVTVTCEIRDKDGNLLDTPTRFGVSIDSQGNPLDPNQNQNAFDVSDNTITFKRSGIYLVTCSSTKTTLSDRSPATIKVNPGAPVKIETTMHDTDLVAGEAQPVVCSAQDEFGNYTNTTTKLVVSPDSGYTSDNNIFRPTNATNFEVKCGLKDGSLVSQTGIQVTVVAGPPRHLRASLAKNVAKPGEKITFTCEVTDAFDNPITDLKVQAGFIDGITQDDFNVLEIYGTRAGIYTISCTPSEAWVRNVVEIGDILEIIPGDPARLEVQKSPDKLHYKLSETLTLSYRVYDSYDNLIPGAEIEPVSVPSGVTEESELRYSFGAEDTYEFTVQVKDHSNLKQTVTVVVDQTGPVIVISSPKRGSMVQQSGTTVTVTGKVTDHKGLANSIASFTINGVNVSLSGNGSFSYPFSGVSHGLNVITAEATDSVGLKTRIVQAFYFSTKFHSMNAAPGTAPKKLADSLLVKLNPKMIDDDVHDQRFLDDLATIFEVVLNDLDIFAYLPRPAYSGNGYDVFVEKITYSKIKAKLKPYVGGLQLDAEIPNFYAEIEAKGPFDPDGELTATKITISASLQIDVINEEPVVTVPSVAVQVHNFDIDVHWAINWLINFFEDDIQKDIEDSFEAVLKNQVSTMVEDFLSQLNLGGNYQIPNFFDQNGPPITLLVDSKLSSAEFNQSGGLLGLGTIIYAKKNIKRQALGTILRDGCLQSEVGDPTFNLGKKLGIGVSVDLLNMALFSIWWNGALTFSVPPSTLTAGGGIPGMTINSLDIDMLLPPILSNCDGGKMRLQIGDVKLDLKLKLGNKDVRLSLFASFQADTELGFENQQINLTVKELKDQDLYLEVADVEGLDSSNIDSLTAFLKTTALPLLTSLIGGQTFNAFPLPEIDFSAFAPGAKLKLIDSVMSVDKDFLVIDSGIE